MDELTLMRGFRAERVKQNPAARAAARQVLEARFEPLSPTLTPTASPARPYRHRLLAFAGATATAAVVAGFLLVLGSGPTAQPAAAEILHETAQIAISADAATGSPLPGPGQLLYTKVRRVDLTGWISGCDPLEDQRGCAFIGGTMSGADAFNALVPTTQEEWRGEDGIGRMRWVAGTPQFWSEEEQGRWEAAGSPPPPPFDPEYQRIVAQRRNEESIPPGYTTRTREENETVIDTETVVDPDQAKGQPFRFPDTSKLPTDPKALRRAVESNEISHPGFNLVDPSAKRLDSKGTTAELLNILSEGDPMTPQLRAAVFNALAEMPGIEVETDATDSLGREGFAIRSIEGETEGGLEYIFDPDTAKLLARRSFLGKSDQSPYLQDVPAGTTISETVYMESGVVDSTDETAR
jgi:hypothetical protein